MARREYWVRVRVDERRCDVCDSEIRAGDDGARCTTCDIDCCRHCYADVAVSVQREDGRGQPDLRADATFCFDCVTKSGAQDLIESLDRQLEAHWKRTDADTPTDTQALLPTERGAKGS